MEKKTDCKDALFKFIFGTEALNLSLGYIKQTRAFQALSLHESHVIRTASMNYT